MAQNPSDDNIAHDKFGRPILDRYGRPVQRRGPAAGQDATRVFGDGGTGAKRSAVPPSRQSRQSASGAQPEPPQYRRQPEQPPKAAPYERPAEFRNQGQYAPQQQYQQAPPQQQYAPQQPPPQQPQQPQRAPRSRRPRKRRRIRPLRIIGALLLVILLVLAGTAWWVDSKINRIDALSGYDGQVGNTSGSNWLLVGSDSREGMSEEDGERYAAGDLSEGGSRTDTIIVVHVPSFGGKPTMVSIPRDSYVEVPGYGMDKINSAFSYGGPQLLQQSVEQATGLRMDHYMEVGFGGFGDIVDAVGGVELCPEEPIDDPMAGLDLEAGCQEMDGPTALGYVRTRYTSASGDLDRVERQREFLSAVVSKVGSFGTLANPFKAMPLVSAFTDALTVDEGDHVWHLAHLALGMIRGAEQETVPIGGFADADVGSVVQWDEQAAEELFSDLR
ncbi:MAG TPA: LCP family protein [Candidatus Corynebacterium avicola]|uniref:LCP family protein n=1 Tax=Candidatus Corynebacterium avicola TaxID=2838527 RepID=A0A9D1RTX2_9CORY|nr:LCP family protein [Candidatus Corynebacterium avicola]